MPGTPAPSRRLLPWLLLGAGAGLVLLACVVLGGVDLLGFGARRGDQVSTEGQDRQAGAATDARPSGPTLVGVPSATRAPHGPVLVHVRDRQGAALEGAEVRAVKLQPAASGPDALPVLETVRSDAAGLCRFADLPYDGSVLLEVKRESGEPEGQPDVKVLTGSFVSIGSEAISIFFQPAGEGADGGPSPTVEPTEGSLPVTPTERANLVPIESAWHVRVPVTGPDLTITLERGLPLRVDAREAGQGRLRKDIVTHAWPRWATESPAQEPTLAVLPGEDVFVRCRADAPAGWVAPTQGWLTKIHPLAQRLEAVVLLRPEADLVLEVPESCRPYRPEDCALMITVGGVTLERPQLEALGQERLRVRGAPFLVDDVVTVSGSIRPGCNVSGSASLGEDARTRVVVPLIALEGSLAEWAILSFDGFNFRLVDQILRPRTERAESARTPLSLRVVAWDGTPAAGAHVLLGDETLVADEAGRVRFADVPDGMVAVTVLGAGAAQVTAFEIAPGVRTEHVIDATAGGTLDVEVVDDQQRPVAYPSITLAQSNGLRHAEVVDGTQRIDPYGDASGRRTYRFVSTGTCKVIVELGSRTVEAEVTVADGARETVRVVLPAARP